MVVLRAGMCPGLDEGLVGDLRAAGIKTGELFYWRRLRVHSEEGQ